MSEIVLYDIIQDEKEKPELIEIKNFEVLENIYDEIYGIDIMSRFLHLGIMANEHSYILGINSNYEIQGIINIGIGNTDEVQNNTRIIILFLSILGSKKFTCYHNHPNDNIMASSDDIANEAQMEFIAKLLNIDFLGSYILGRKQYIKVGDKKAKLIEEA